MTPEEDRFESLAARPRWPRYHARDDFGSLEHFDPGRGRAMREWVALEPGTNEEWPPLAEEARDYVAALSAR